MRTSTKIVIGAGVVAGILLGLAFYASYAA
jgi:hypothetical protein